MWPRDGGRIDQRSRLHKQVLTKPISLDFALPGDPSGILDDFEEGLRTLKYACEVWEMNQGLIWGN